MRVGNFKSLLGVLLLVGGVQKGHCVFEILVGSVGLQMGDRIGLYEIDKLLPIHSFAGCAAFVRFGIRD